MSAAGTADAAIAVLGAGSWGTALAIQFARSGTPVRLWGRDAAQLRGRWRASAQQRALPAGRRIPRVAAGRSSDLRRHSRGAHDVLVAVPSHALSRAADAARAAARRRTAQVAWATKGFEVDTGQLPHQVAREVLGHASATARCSPGPTFAREVGAGLPTAMTIASRGCRLCASSWRRICRRRTSAPTPPPTSSAWRSAAR